MIQKSKYHVKEDAIVMRKTSLNQGWEFMRGEPSNFPGMQRETKVVNLPHDFMVEGDVVAHARGGSEVGFYHGGVTRRCLS